MELASPQLAAQQALTRQAIGLETIKKSAQADQQVANILEESARNVSALTSRGANLNITV